MSNMSFGLVFTSKWLEIWKIEDGTINKGHQRSQFSPEEGKKMQDQLIDAVSKTIFGDDSSAKFEILGVYIPENLKKALICGITKDGSLKAAEKLARTLLFSPEQSYLQGDDKKFLENIECDVVIIGGGFDDSRDDRIKSLILDIAESEWFKKCKPAVIYAGNKESVSTAQLKFSPFSDFYEMGNVLEYGQEEKEQDSVLELDTINQFSFSESGGMLEKIKLNTYQESIFNFMEFMCREMSGRLVSVMINDNYSVLNQCRLESGKPVIESRSLPKKADDLSSDDFSGLYRDFSHSNGDLKGDIFTADDILPIGTRKHENFYRPDRIVGICLSENITVKRFMDLISDPDIVRGIIEYYFDNTGFFMMCGAILSGGGEKTQEKVEKYIKNYDLSSGWLVIPDGSFAKDEIALEVYIGGEENEKTSQLFWGKRYTIPIRENSVAELRFKGTAFLAGKSRTVVLKTGDSSRNLVVDIRKEKS